MVGAVVRGGVDRADDLALVDGIDDLELVGLVGELDTSIVDRDLLAHERLALLHQLAHARLDALEVVASERFLDVEVVVEPILDRRSDGPLGAGKQLGDGLGHDVRGRVTKDESSRIGVGVDGLDGHDPVGPRGLGQWAIQVPLGPVRGGGDHRTADGLEFLEGLQRSGVGSQLRAGVTGLDGQ